jgi:hypothetical protein
MNKALEETWRAGRHEWWCTIHFGRRPALLGREERHGRGGAQAIFAVHDGTELSGKMQEWHGDSTVVRNRYQKPHFENCKRHFLNILSVLKDGFVTRSNSWKCVLWIVPPSRYVRGFTDCLEQPQESKLYQLSRRHQKNQQRSRGQKCVRSRTDNTSRSCNRIPLRSHFRFGSGYV